MAERKAIRLFAGLFLTVTGGVSAAVWGGRNFNSNTISANNETVYFNNNYGGPFSAGRVVLKDTNLGIQFIITPSDLNASQYQPAVSPDGKKVIFDDFRNNGEIFVDSLYLMDLESGKNIEIAGYEYAGNTPAPVWIDNETIAFRNLKPDRDKEDYSVANKNLISTIKIDGTDRKELGFTFNKDFRDITAHCFDPKAKRILFSAIKFKNPDGSDRHFEIYSIDTDGTNSVMITDIGSSMYYLTDMECKGDGKIYMKLYPRGYSERYVMNSDGTSLELAK